MLSISISQLAAVTWERWGDEHSTAFSAVNAVAAERTNGKKARCLQECKRDEPEYLARAKIMCSLLVVI